MFLLGVKIEIEIIEVKHQKFFLIVWLELPRLKILQDFESSLRMVKGL